MIGEGELLQANATIIAGVLIFLSLAPMFRETIAQLGERKFVLGVLIFIISMLLGSTVTLFLSEAPWMPIRGFYIAVILFVGGVSGVLGLVAGLFVFYNKISEILKERRDDDRS
jgi:hypothetical protein